MVEADAGGVNVVGMSGTARGAVAGRGEAFADGEGLGQARLRMVRRRRQRVWGAPWIAVFGVLVALWLSGRGPWIAAESQSPHTPPVERAPQPAPVPPVDAPAHREPQGEREGSTRTPTTPIDPQSVWASSAACDAAIGELLAAPRAPGVRVASWNLRWFPYGAKNQPRKGGGTDVAWMACAMASLRADVIAVQEVMTNPPGRAAWVRLMDRLDALTHGHWLSYLDACPGDRRQHVGFLYDSARVQVDRLREVPEINPHGSACGGGLRPGAAARVALGDQRWDLLTVHLDSGDEGRDYDNRQVSVRALMELLPAREHPSLLALGDFNTMGCERCEPPVPVAHELTALNQALHARGYRQVTPAVDDALLCSHHYEGHAQMLDRAITTLPASQARLHPGGWCGELSCQRPRTTSDALEHLSDHCPIVVELVP